MADFQSMIEQPELQQRRAAGRFEQFDGHEPAPLNSTPCGRVLKLLCKVHHIICLAFLLGTCDLVVGLALACYGATIGLVLAALQLTREKLPISMVRKSLASRSDGRG